MPRKKAVTVNLPPADELFSTQEQRDEAQLEKVQDMPLELIDGFPNHPFKVKMDESMESMVESVKTFGILNPAIVRQKDDGRYGLVSGHRRKFACENAGLETMPCIVRNLTEDEAIIFMVDSNLQRETVLPSEKARSFKMKLDALNRQGKRTDLDTSTPVESKLRSNEQVAKEAGESREQIRRYIRLNELVPNLLDMVDEGQIALRSAVELSYLPHEQQEHLLVVIEGLENQTPSYAQATEMRKLDENEQLTNEMMISIMQEEKPSQVKHFKLPREKIQHFFPAETPPETIEETIVKALELWHKNQQEQ